MKHKFRLLLVALGTLVCTFAFAQKQFMLKAPNGKLQVDITVDQKVEYAVSHSGDAILSSSPISITLADGKMWGVNAKLVGNAKRTVNQIINSPHYKKRQVTDNFNELTLKFNGDYQIIFRAYNDGIAYRFVSTDKKPFVIKNEEVKLNFPTDSKAWIPYPRANTDSFEQQFANSFENIYEYKKLSEWDKKRIAFLPITIEAANGKKACVTEADLLNYPGLYLSNADGDTSLEGVLALYPKDIEQGGHNKLQGVVRSHEDYIAKFDKGCALPWRTLIVSEKDAELANNDMVYKLSTPTPLTDLSWIRPGKVAWDWWNTWNLYDVDFRAGVNNDTYKYYIDFASKNGVEYVILDEGWAVNLQADLMQVVPEIDLQMLADYAKSKRVGLILWAGYHAFNRDIEGICKHYASMGIKGFKVDFMDRDDQLMVDFHHRAAQIAAKHKMMLDFHGTYKPTGLQRTYPNVVNFEGVFGLEQMKWDSGVDMVTYDVTIPFVRMVAGPLDYTQGAMRNATKSNYRSVGSEAMSQGTRCHQLAQYVIYESPLNMLCDNPKSYESEKECLEYIAMIPTTWDETVAVNGEVAKYVTIARRKGAEWYLGSLNNWDNRSIELDLSFLGDGKFRAEIFRDGINADRAARDYKKERIDIPNDRKLTIKMAQGGGYVMRIFRSN